MCWKVIEELQNILVFFRIETMSLLHNWISSNDFDHDWIHILYKFGTIFKFIIDTLGHLNKNIFVIKLDVLLTEPVLVSSITFQLSNGSCMLYSFALNEFLYILYVNHSPCLHLPLPSSKRSYLYGLCPSPDIPPYDYVFSRYSPHFLFNINT